MLGMWKHGALQLLRVMYSAFPTLCESRWSELLEGVTERKPDTRPACCAQCIWPCSAAAAHISRTHGTSMQRATCAHPIPLGKTVELRLPLAEAAAHLIDPPPNKNKIKRNEGGNTQLLRVHH